MIFTKDHAQQVVDRRKRQTRRPVKPGEWAFMDVDDPTKILSVVGPNRRLKWQVGKDYAAQPGRGKKSIGRTPPVVEIRRERLLPISVDDLVAEGCPFIMEDERKLDWFLELWNSLYRKPFLSVHNPEVWVLVFEDQILSAGKMTDPERLSAASLDRISRREGLTYSNMERFSKENQEGQ